MLIFYLCVCKLRFFNCVVFIGFFMYKRVFRKNKKIGNVNEVYYVWVSRVYVCCVFEFGVFIG